MASAKLNILDCDGYGVINYFENRYREGQYKNRDCIYIDTKTGQKIILISGGGKSGDQRYIKGNTYGTVYITEVNECHPDFIQETFDRTISSNDRKIFHDLNPKSPNHWYYKDILDFHESQQKENSDYGYNWGKFTLLDNLSIDEKKLNEVLRTYDRGTVHWERDILGNRKQPEGLIYTRFANNPAKYLIDEVPHLMEINVGLDFGGEKSAHSLVATGITPNHGKLIALMSERHFNKDYPPDGILPCTIDKIAVEFVGKVIEKYKRCDYLYWDNEATTLGQGIKKAVENAYPQVTVQMCYKSEIRTRIDFFRLLIGEDRFFYTKEAQTVASALEDAMFNPKEDFERLDDGSTDIDTLDSLEYTITRQMRQFIRQ